MGDPGGDGCGEEIEYLKKTFDKGKKPGSCSVFVLGNSLSRGRVPLRHSTPFRKSGTQGVRYRCGTGPRIREGAGKFVCTDRRTWKVDGERVFFASENN